MPTCGSQCYLCDVPIRFDTYVGCSHGCKYCFAKAFQDISKIKKGESSKILENFINGKRDATTNWCDWDIPIHWGGMSDPFQPCEKIHKISYECLQVLAKTKYPFIVSTKGKLVADEEYLKLLEQCNCVVQISMVCSKYDKLELGTPTFEERLKILKEVSSRVKRTIVRVQPYMHEVYQDVYDNLERFKDAGAYGVIIEGMKFKKKKNGLVKLGNDFVYPYQLIKNDFLKLKKKAHEVGLKIYSGENRTRKFGDSLTCCGIDGLEGFKPNTYNLNHLLNGDENCQPTEKMKEINTCKCFLTLNPRTDYLRKIEKQSFSYTMLEYYKDKKKSIDDVFGINEK